MTYDEAAEIAFCGGKVLHPATLHPAVEADIPVRVLDTRNPTGPNTVIWREVPASRPVVRTVVQKRGICLVNVVTPRMLGAHGTWRKPAKRRPPRSRARRSPRPRFGLDDGRRRPPPLGAFLDELRARRGDRRAQRRRVRRRPRDRRVAADARRHLTLAHEHRAAHGLDGARRTNVGIVVDEADTAKAVNALHEAAERAAVAKATAK
jgi:hypothetical protein